MDEIFLDFSVDFAWWGLKCVNNKLLAFMMDQSLFKGTLNQKKMEITWNLYYANASLKSTGTGYR